MDRPAVPGGRRHSLRRRSLMLATLLLAGLFAAPGATALLFLPSHTPSSTAGPWPWTRRVVLTVLGCAYLWEMCDALGSERWRRRIPDGAPPEEAVDQPFVSLQVPAYNEPPEMVIETLRSLKGLDYPRCQVVLIDDNSDDESLWRP